MSLFPILTLIPALVLAGILAVSMVGERRRFRRECALDLERLSFEWRDAVLRWWNAHPENATTKPTRESEGS